MDFKETKKQALTDAKSPIEEISYAGVACLEMLLQESWTEEELEFLKNGYLKVSKINNEVYGYNIIEDTIKLLTEYYACDQRGKRDCLSEINMNIDEMTWDEGFELYQSLGVKGRRLIHKKLQRKGLTNA